LLPAGIVLAGALALVVAAGLYYYFFHVVPKDLDTKRTLSGPPTILVHSPLAGDSVAAGGTLLARATMTGRTPIVRAEIWLDGNLAASQMPEGASQHTIYPVFPVEIGAGTHSLYWRAVDTDGLVGQTLPVPVAGIPPSADDTATIIAQEGDSLDAIASELAVDAGLLRELNPDLAQNSLPPDTPVRVPPARNRAAESNPQEAGTNVPSSAPLQVPPGLAALLPADPTVDVSSLIPGLLSALPSAPSHLAAGFEDCRVRLVWNDNAANEVGFRIWMEALGGPALNIHTTKANAGTGQTMFEFDSPSFGIYSFWVTAFNALGDQPSGIAWIAVNDASCGEGLATYLEVEGLGMRVTGGWQQIYCWLSLEGMAAKRIPEDGEYLDGDAMGSVDIHQWLGGKNRLLLRMPADDDVSLTGDCWGWQGNLPHSMGDFGVAVPKEHWDNRTLQISNTNYLIDFRIRPLGPTEANGAFSYLDYGLAPPEQVTAAPPSPDPTGSYDPRIIDTLRRNPKLRWEWAGNVQDVTGFTIYVDGAVAGQVSDPAGALTSAGPRNTFETTLALPAGCGYSYRIEMRTNSGDAQSPLSQAYDYRQPPCQAYAQVDIRQFGFSTIETPWVPCRTVQALIHVLVNDTEFVFEGPAGCRIPYVLSDFQLRDSLVHVQAVKEDGRFDPDTMIVPVALDNPSVSILVTFQDESDIPYILMCAHSSEVAPPPMSSEEWAQYLEQHTYAECGPDPRFGESSAQGYISYVVRGIVTAPASP